MDYIRDYLSTVLHLPLLLPCFAVFPVRFFVSRLVIAHTDAIRAKFYWRKRITFFSKNTFYPICSTQAKKTFSCSLDSKLPLVSQGGACSRTNWPIQPELIPVPLGWKDKENYIARLPPSPPPPTKISSHFPDNFPVPIYTPEWREALWKVCFLLANTVHSDPAGLWTRTSQPGVQRTIAQNA